jgi:hypothetical protein
MAGNVGGSQSVRIRVRVTIVDRNRYWLRFPYDSTSLRPHYLHPHPYHDSSKHVPTLVHQPSSSSVPSLGSLPDMHA